MRGNSKIQKMPALFIGHGSPMNAIEDNEFSRSWKELANRLPRPKAILFISAHWETKGVFTTSAKQLNTIHDFGGFPQALFDVRYNVSGDAALIKRVANLVTLAPVHTDEKRGLDHGVWSVLLPMYPDADIPVVQLSLDMSQLLSFHYDLAKQLAPLRDEEVLIIASGNIVHNLRFFKYNESNPYDWAVRFNEEIKKSIVAGNTEKLLDYESLGPDAALSVPSSEHFIPLLYIMALQQQDDKISFFNDVVSSAISMTSVMLD
jgi:4,5-DOPA dioxygenase extradiol